MEDNVWQLIASRCPSNRVLDDFVGDPFVGKVLRQITVLGSCGIVDSGGPRVFGAELLKALRGL